MTACGYTVGLASGARGNGPASSNARCGLIYQVLFSVITSQVKGCNVNTSSVNVEDDVRWHKAKGVWRKTANNPDRPLGYTLGYTPRGAHFGPRQCRETNKAL